MGGKPPISPSPITPRGEGGWETQSPHPPPFRSRKIDSIFPLFLFPLSILSYNTHFNRSKRKKMTAITDARFEEFTKTIKEFEVEFDEETSGIVQEAINKVYGPPQLHPRATTGATTSKPSGSPTDLRYRPRSEEEKPFGWPDEEIGAAWKACSRRSRPSMWMKKRTTFPAVKINMNGYQLYFKLENAIWKRRTRDEACGAHARDRGLVEGPWWWGQASVQGVM